MRMIASVVRQFRWAGALLGLFAALFLAGCSSETGGFANMPETTGVAGPGPGAGAAPRLGSQGAEVTKVGDVLTVSISDIPNAPTPFTVKVREDGTITLLLNQTFTAAGKTAGALEHEAHDRYVPKFFTQMTISIYLQNGYYFVDGEVKQPNRYPYTGPITVLKAVSSASGFTDFAKRTKVQLTRTDGTRFTVNCKKALNDPNLDLEVIPGDKIHVPRKLW
jgi:protein involved in polysaccharide export with SLBB domain